MIASSAVSASTRISASERASSTAAMASRTGADGKDAAAKPRAGEPKSSGAVAKLVVSMADALDFRFSHIETALADLAERLGGPQPAREDDTLNLSVSSLAQELHSASQALKSGLSDFVGVSAALAAPISPWFRQYSASPARR